MPTQQTIDALVADLVTNGLTERFGLTESWRHGTSFKSYCRSQLDPSVGLLFSTEIPPGAEEHPRTLAEIRSRLAREIDHLAAFSRLGPRTPAVYTSVVEFLDNRSAAGRSAAGFLIEHIDGAGPYKPAYEVRRIKAAAERYGSQASQAAQTDYAALRKAADTKCPNDLQVIVTPTGNLVVLDIEQLGIGRAIAEWPA